MPILTDTLAVDTARLAAWRADSDFDYAREFVQTDTSAVDWLLATVDRWLSTTFGYSFYSRPAAFFWVCVGVVGIVAVAVVVIYRHPGLFRRSERQPLDYEVTEDNIYGVDFEAEIERALRQADYYSAARLVYLQTLRRLSDDGLVAWMPSKTPSQYAREWLSEDFGRLSQQFLRIRYGGYRADEALYREMRGRQQAVFSALDAKGGGQ